LFTVQRHHAFHRLYHHHALPRHCRRRRRGIANKTSSITTVNTSVTYHWSTLMPTLNTTTRCHHEATISLASHVGTNDDINKINGVVERRGSLLPRRRQQTYYNITIGYCIVGTPGERMVAAYHVTLYTTSQRQHLMSWLFTDTLSPSLPMVIVNGDTGVGRRYHQVSVRCARSKTQNATVHRSVHR